MGRVRAEHRPDIGWFAYPPLSGPQYGIGKRADIWAQMITFTEVAALAVAVDTDRHDPEAARAGHDAGARCRSSSGRRWSTSLMVIFSMPSVALASGMLLSRPAGGHAFLQSRRARRCAAVAASVLVLRPPGSLHHLPARDGLRQRDRRDLLAPVGIRLSDRRTVARRDRDSRLRAVGPSHVRDRPAARRLQLLHRREHGRVDPDGAAIVLLDRDHLGRAAAVAGADALRHRASSSRSSSAACRA